MADQPKINAVDVYRTVADLLPVEGRDFKINLATHTGDGKQDLLVEGLTPMGKAWVPFLIEKLGLQMKDQGVGVENATTGEVKAELPTVNSIRRAIVDEFDSKLQARIHDQEVVAKQNAEKAAAAQKAKDANPGEAQAADDARKALNAQRNAESSARHLKAVAAKVSQIRANVAERAKKVAEKEKETGQDWSVDPEAPLETLFDRTNAEDRLRKKEDLILRMAELAVQMDDLGGQAVHMAKFYALTK